MAIKELWDSQEMHVTAEGTTATRKFTCTWAEALTGNDGTYWLPVIGNFWSDNRRDLICTDLDMTANGRVNVIVSAFFSTEKSSVRRKRREDFAESWQENLEVYAEEVPVTDYLNYTVPNNGKNSAVTEKKWTEVWETTTGSKPETAPDLFQLQAKAAWHLTVYGSSFRSAQILTHVTEINRFDFMKPYLSVWQQSEILTDDDPDITGFTDIGRWMFMGARVDRIRPICWQYDYTFLYEPNGWNTPKEYEGTAAKVTTNMYPAFDFELLFDGMRSTDEDGEGSFAAQDNTTQGGF